MTENFYTAIQAACISVFAVIAGYFDSTITYLFALLISFLFNIIAGMRADEVKIRIERIYPPKVLENYRGNKLKDSLMELFLISLITYILKVLIDLLKYENVSGYVVQVLMAIAIYYYVRNALRNLSSVYSKNKWLSAVYHLIAFKFRNIVGGDIADIVDKEENVKDNEATK